MSLLEVMVVATLSSIILGVVISLLVGLQKWDRNLRDHGVRSEQFARLAETIRADIRQGTDVSLPTKQTLVIAAPGNRQFRYELNPAGCQRIVAAPGEAKPFTDLFSIGPAAAWTLEDGPPGRGRLILVKLDRVARVDVQDSRPTPLLVYGILGADLPAGAAPMVEE